MFGPYSISAARSSPRKRGPRAQSEIALDSRLRGNERNVLQSPQTVSRSRRHYVTTVTPYILPDCVHSGEKTA